ncbi:MAG: hypothetical protein AB7F32_09505, partial [Victivallaceae bacterium]
PPTFSNLFESGAFSFLRCKNEKAQYIKVFVKDVGVRGRRKKPQPTVGFFQKVLSSPSKVSGWMPPLWFWLKEPD